MTGPLEKEGVLQPLTPPLSVPPTAGENILQQDLWILEEVPSQGVPPLKQGQGFLPEENIIEQEQPAAIEEQQLADQGAAEPPATEGTPPATVEEEPVPPCPEGQVLDEESRLCVLEESEVAEEPEEQPAEEEQQPSDEGDGSEENSDNN